MHPKFAWDLIWGTITDNISPAVCYSLSADPLPQPLQSELENTAANKTIHTHPDLFKITCKINIKKFNELLEDHPNQPFVQFVIVGLTKGFWPWAEQQEGYPVTHCEVQHSLKDDQKCDLLLEKEIIAEQFSKQFSELLPRWNVVFTHAVPKPADKLCPAVDHGDGSCSINCMING